MIAQQLKHLVNLQNRMGFDAFKLLPSQRNMQCLHRNVQQKQ